MISVDESSIAARRRIARAMLDKATSTAPIQSPWQGVANMVNAGFAGWEEGRLDREERQAREAGGTDASAMRSGSPSPVSSVAQAMAGPEPKPADISKAPANLLPRFAQAEAQYGLPKNFLAQTAKVESSFNPSAKNPNSSAAGLFQFTRGTARDYGLTNPLDPIASTDAAARLAADNKATLTRALGREPTAGELYLAHQQGGGGASKLLANPNARAVDVVGRDAVLLNGGREDMTAGEFARRWTSKVAMGGDPDMPAPGAMPAAAETGASGFAVPGQPAPMTGRTFDQITSGAPLDPVFQSEGVSQPWMGTALKPSPAVSHVAAALTGRQPPPRPADLPAPGAVEAVGRMPQPAAPIMPDLSNESGAGARELQVMSEQARQGQPQAASNPISAIAAALMGQGAPAPAEATPAARMVATALAGTPERASAAANTPSLAPEAPSVPQTATFGVMAGAGQGDARLSAARRVLNNPYAAAGDKLEAKAIIEQSLKGADYETVTRPDGSVYRVPKTGGGAPVQVFGPQSKPEGPTGDMREYDLYTRQERAAGREPDSFTNWSRGNKAAGKTEVNIDTKGAGKFVEKANEIQAKRYGEMAEAADAARTMQGDLDMLEGISKGLSTGRGAEARLAMAQFAKAWGFDDIASGLTGGKLPEMEAFSSLIDKLTPQMRQGMPGAASDRDVAIFRNALPSMLKTPEGNQIVMGTLRAMNAYKAQAGDLAGQALRGEISQADADKAIRALESPFSRFREFRAAQDKPPSSNAAKPPAAPAARIGSRAEFDALPSGTPFIDPEGNERIKP